MREGEEFNLRDARVRGSSQKVPWRDVLKAFVEQKRHRKAETQRHDSFALLGKTFHMLLGLWQDSLHQLICSSHLTPKQFLTNLFR